MELLWFLLVRNYIILELNILAFIIIVKIKHYVAALDLFIFRRPCNHRESNQLFREYYGSKMGACTMHIIHLIVNWTDSFWFRALQLANIWQKMQSICTRCVHIHFSLWIYKFKIIAFFSVDLLMVWVNYKVNETKCWFFLKKGKKLVPFKEKDACFTKHSSNQNQQNIKTDVELNVSMVHIINFSSINSYFNLKQYYSVNYKNSKKKTNELDIKIRMLRNWFSLLIDWFFFIHTLLKIVNNVDL